MTILEIIVLLPILAAVAIFCGAPPRVTAFIASAAVLICAFYVAFQFDRGFDPLDRNFDYQYFDGRASGQPHGRAVFEAAGFPEIRLAFGVDGLSVVMMLLTAIVLLTAILAAPRQADIKGSARLFYASCLLIGGGAMGAFLATDLFFFYAFHELALIPTFLMIGLFGHGRDRLKTAWTITIYLGVGSVILLVGLIAAVTAIQAASFDIPALIAKAREVGLGANQQMKIYLPLLIGFGILVSLFPFHSWAPAAYADAPAPVAMLHAGVLKKFGLYGLIRIANPMFPQGAEALSHLVLILLVGNIIIIGLVTIAQKSLDRMLGYSSVMHMGYIFLGIASGTYIGMTGAVLLMFGHGISIAALFALAGFLRRRFDTLEFAKMGGLAKVLPAAGLLFGFAAFAAIGLPGFANFSGEALVFFGAFKNFAGRFEFIHVATVLALWGVVISAVYMLRAFRTIFKGSLARLPAVPDLSWAEKLPVIFLLGALLFTGFVPELLIQYLRPALEGIMASIGQ